MPDSPIILLDMDGVLVHVGQTILEEVNEEFGRDLALEDVEAFDYREWLPPEEAQFAFDRWHVPQRYAGVPMAPGAREGVKELQRLGRVVVVSSPLEGHATSKIRWLNRHGFDRENRVLATDKSLLDCKGAVLIDDKASHVRDFDGPAVLYDKPYNQFYDTEYRAHNWSQVVSHVRRILDEEEP